MTRKKKPSDPLGDLLGPGMTRELAAIERKTREIRRLQATDIAQMAREARDWPDPRDKFGAQAMFDDTALSTAEQVATGQQLAQALDHSTAASGQHFGDTVTRAREMLDTGQGLEAAFRSTPFDRQIAEAVRDSLSAGQQVDSTLREFQQRCRDLTEVFPMDAIVEDISSQVTRIARDAAPLLSIERTIREIDLSAVSEAAAFHNSSLIDQLADSLNRSSLWKYAEAAEQFELHFSRDVRRHLFDELFQQPGWREIIEQASAPSGSDSDQSSNVSLWQLVREYLTVHERAVPETETQFGPGPSTDKRTSWRLGLLMTASSLLLTFCNWHDGREIRKQLDHLTTEVQEIRRQGRWVIARDIRIAVHSSPRKGSAARMRLKPGTVLTERRRNGDWVEVDVWSCDDTRQTGWIEIDTLDRLEHSDDVDCEPVLPEAQPDPLMPPPLIAQAGAESIEAWHEFFHVRLVNPRTRQAYWRACTRFALWCERQDLSLDRIKAAHAAAWRDELMTERSAATVKQHLSATKGLFEWLQIRQVVPVSPLQSVRAPRQTRRRARTPALRPEHVLRLFDQFESDALVDLRDRALLAVMTYALARASAVAGLRVADIDLRGPEPTLTLHEKRGQKLSLPLNTTVVGWLQDYLDATGIAGQHETRLFRSLGRGRGGKQVTERGLSRQDIHAIVRRRFARAGINAPCACHALRATGITMLLMRQVPIGIVARLAGHASVATTQNYEDRSWPDMRRALESVGARGAGEGDSAGGYPL